MPMFASFIPTSPFKVKTTEPLRQVALIQESRVQSNYGFLGTPTAVQRKKSRAFNGV